MFPMRGGTVFLPSANNIAKWICKISKRFYYFGGNSNITVCQCCSSTVDPRDVETLKEFMKCRLYNFKWVLYYYA